MSKNLKHKEANELVDELIISRWQHNRQGLIDLLADAKASKVSKMMVNDSKRIEKLEQFIQSKGVAK